MAKTHSIILVVSCLLILSGCGSVLAHGPVTIITKPTQLTEDQDADFEVQGGALYGLPAATGHGIKVGNIRVTGPALIQDLFVNGCIVVDRANRVELTRVWIQGCPSDGLKIVSDPVDQKGGNRSCCAKLDHVVVKSSGCNGIKIINSNDVFITMSEFEDNGCYGMELEGSSATRIVISDFGGNRRGGMFADHNSAFALIGISQFGNNAGVDATFESVGNVLIGSGFIGPPGPCSIRTNLPQVIGDNNYGPRPVC